MRRLWTVMLLAVAAGCGLNGNYRDTDVPMESVSQLDTERYLGLWYEIARYPNRFEEGCFAVTAEYARREDGRLSVTNTCRDASLETVTAVAEGSARIAAPGQLKVKFVEWLPFEGDYWVIGLTPDYSVSVVGVPSGDFGWILARTPTFSPAALAEAKAVLRDNGYDLNRLYLTPQSAN